MNNNKIGIFDSGIGGVTVLKEIIKVLPNEDIYYFSDSKNNPYGDKTDKEILEICNNIVEILLKENCKAIVIACNTASAKAATKLREKYADIPIIAIEPAYKMVYDFAYDKKTLVMATKGTIESEKFHKLYNKYNNHNTELLECIGLADIIEEGNEQKIKEVLGDVEFFNGAASLSKHLKDILIEKNLINDKREEGIIEFVDSSDLIQKRERFYKYLKNN